MIVWSISAKDNKELSNKLASYIRRGFDVVQIVYGINNENDNSPYKAFLINKNLIDENYIKKLIENFDPTAKKVKVSNSFLRKNLYVIECRINPYKINSLESVLYGNTKFLIEIDDKKIYFGFVSILPDKIILKNPFDAKTNEIVNIDKDELKKVICRLGKR